MAKIVNTLSSLFAITTSFIPPVVFYVVVPFVGLYAFIKLVGEMK